MHYYIAFPLLPGGELLAKLNEKGKFSEEAAGEVLAVILVSLGANLTPYLVVKSVKDPDMDLVENPVMRVDSSGLVTEPRESGRLKL